MVPRLQQKDLDENNMLSHFFLAGADVYNGKNAPFINSLQGGKNLIKKCPIYPKRKHPSPHRIIWGSVVLRDIKRMSQI